jgi:maleate isomerase
MGYGLENTATLLNAMRAGWNAPTITTGTAVIEAFDALAARRIVFISREEVRPNNTQIAYINAAGFEVVGYADGGSEGRQSATISPLLWRDVALRARNPRADAYFISCADSRSSGVIAELEDELGRPVVTSNQAALWSALRTLDLDDKIERYGALFGRDRDTTKCRFARTETAATQVEFAKE